MGGQIKAVERLASGGLEHQRGPPRSRTSSKSGLADAPSSSSLSPYSYARRLRLTDNPRREARPNRVPIAVGAIPLFAVAETFAVLRTPRKLPSSPAPTQERGFICR